MKYQGNDIKGRQNELIVAGGKGNNSNINVLKKGISINEIINLKDLPPLNSNGIFDLNGLVILNFFASDSLVALLP
jgi:hypothetical protein